MDGHIRDGVGVQVASVSFMDKYTDSSNLVCSISNYLDTAAWGAGRCVGNDGIVSLHCCMDSAVEREENENCRRKKPGRDKR